MGPGCLKTINCSSRSQFGRLLSINIVNQRVDSKQHFLVVVEKARRETIKVQSMGVFQCKVCDSRAIILHFVCINIFYAYQSSSNDRIF